MFCSLHPGRSLYYTASVAWACRLVLHLITFSAGREDFPGCMWGGLQSAYRLQSVHRPQGGIFLAARRVVGQPILAAASFQETQMWAGKRACTDRVGASLR